jgi:nucleotide-binding universal stress UspA family protein
MNRSDQNHAPTARRIVVGIDGSGHALDAALWAATLADRRGVPLHLVHAFHSAGPSSVLGRAHVDEYVERRTGHGEALIDQARREILARCPRVWVTGEVAEGDPARLLVALSYDASLVCVGTRGHGGFAGLLLGSVGMRLAAHCHCPAVFVPAQIGRTHVAQGASLVLGVEEDEPDSVLEFACRAAADLGVGVRAVHAWEPIELRPGYYLVEPAFMEEEARVLLAGALKRAPLDRFPDVPVTAAAIRGGAAGVLVGAAHGAPLIVVGGHRARSAVSVGVGAVVHALLSHATCPVAVVPATMLNLPAV